MSFSNSAVVFVAAALLCAPAATQETAAPDAAQRRAELRKMAKDQTGALAQLRLAHTAHAWGLSREMWQHLDACFDAERSDAVDRQLRAFLGSVADELVPEHARQADAAKQVRALVRLARPQLGAARRAAVVGLLAGLPDVDEVLRDLAVREALPEQRLAAVEALLRRDATGNEAFVCKRAVRDRDAVARAGAAQVIAAHGDTDRAIRRWAPGFLSDEPATRVFTAEAMANLGNEDAAALIAAAGPFAGTPTRAEAGGIGTRAHMYKLTNRSFVRDFEVEIAQAAAVANPVVDTVRDGVVLDVNVAAVVSHQATIEQAYRAALTRLIGADPGPNPATWADWLRARLPAKTTDEAGRR